MPTESEARQVCEKVIVATRGCEELYLPALLRTRARFDQPPGIAARYDQDGEAALLEIARIEFRSDFSNEGMAKRCDAMMAKPVEQRDFIVERERRCLPTKADCEAFVECNVRLLEEKWSVDAVKAPARSVD